MPFPSWNLLLTYCKIMYNIPFFQINKDLTTLYDIGEDKKASFFNEKMILADLYEYKSAGQILPN